MWPDRVSNPGPRTYESGALPIALRGPANPNAMWSKSIFRGLSFYGINLGIMWTKLKAVVVVVDEVSFDDVSRTCYC